jgi:hypothetical protein
LPAGADPGGGSTDLGDLDPGVVHCGAATKVTQFACCQGVCCADLDLPFAWDGSCYVPESGLGDVCVLVWTDPQVDLTSQQRCESAPAEPAGGSGNTWYEDLVCGGAPAPGSREVHVIEAVGLGAGPLSCFLSSLWQNELNLQIVKAALIRRL